MSKITEFIEDFELFGLKVSHIIAILISIFVLLAFVGVIQLSFSAISGVIVVGIIVYFYFDLIIIQKKTFEDLLQDNAVGTIRMISAASTVGETVGLIIIAVEVREISFTSAIIRFGLIGVLEMLLTFLFIIVFHETLYDSIGKALWGDKEVSGLEKLWIIIKTTAFSLPFFFVALGVTNFIWILYLESIFQVELVIGGVKFWQFSIEPIYVEGFTRVPELTAWFMVFATPILNIILVIFEVKSLSQKIDEDKIKPVKPHHVIVAERKAAKKATTPPAPAPGTPPPAPGTPPSTPPPAPPAPAPTVEPGSVTGLFVKIYQYLCESSFKNGFIQPAVIPSSPKDVYGILPDKFFKSPLFTVANGSKFVDELKVAIKPITVSIDQFLSSAYSYYGLKVDGDLFNPSGKISITIEKSANTSLENFNAFAAVKPEDVANKLHDLVFKTFAIQHGAAGDSEKIHVIIEKHISKLAKDSEEHVKLTEKIKTLDPINDAASLKQTSDEIKKIESSTATTLGSLKTIIEMIYSFIEDFKIV
jgi:hypothetical protein